MFKFFIRTKPDHTIPIGWFLHVLDICSWHAVKNNFCIVSVSMLFFAIACTKLPMKIQIFGQHTCFIGSYCLVVQIIVLHTYMCTTQRLIKLAEICFLSNIAIVDTGVCICM